MSRSTRRAARLAGRAPTLGDLQRALARRKLINFVNYTHDNYQPSWHHKLICSALDDWISGKKRFLMIEAPPRHGKSELASRYAPAFILGRDPNAKIIATSYSADLAKDMNRDCQSVMDTTAYRSVFPRSALPSNNVRTVAHGSRLRNSDTFQLADPRTKGRYYCAGVGGPITGKGADYAIIDDPVKNQEEADSPVYRAKVYKWYRSTLRTRLAPGGRVLLIMTRWHNDDLAGMLLDEMDGKYADQWVQLTLPAIAEGELHPMDPRSPGDPLWPDWFPLKELNPHRADPRIWSALYQQRPISSLTSMFPRAVPKIVDPATRDDKIDGSRVILRVRYWDRAGTEDGGDYSAGPLLALLEDGRIAIEDVERGQWDSLEVEKQIIRSAEIDGPAVDIGLEQEPGASGIYEASSIARHLLGRTVEIYPARTGKVIRAKPISKAWKRGDVVIVRGHWNKPYLDEMDVFPYGRNDDQVDGTSGGYEHLTSDMDIIERLKYLT